MQRFLMLSLVSTLFSLAACSAEQVKRGFYDGIRARNDLQSAPSERVGKPEPPDYPAYQRMRKEQGR